MKALSAEGYSKKGVAGALFWIKITGISESVLDSEAPHVASKRASTEAVCLILGNFIFYIIIYF